MPQTEWRLIRFIARRGREAAMYILERVSLIAERFAVKDGGVDTPTAVMTWRVDTDAKGEIAAGVASQAEAMNIARAETERTGKPAWVSEDWEDSSSQRVDPRGA